MPEDKSNAEGARPLRVAYVSETPTPCRRPLLKQLAADPALDLTAYYLTATQSDHPWKIKEPPRPFEKVLPGLHWRARRSTGDYDHFNISLYGVLSPKNFEVAVFSTYHITSMWTGMYWCRLRGLPYVLQCERQGLRKRKIWGVLFREVLLKPLVRRAGAYLPLGSLAKEYLVTLGAAPARCFYCPDTPDVEMLQLKCAALPPRRKIRQEYQLPAAKPIFLYAGRFVDSKRVDLLIEAFALLRAREVDAALVLVGRGWKESAFRQQVRERNIPDVYFLGFQQPEKLPGLYALADATILPSDDEPWGVVVNESLACGTPVIASDHVGAAPDLIESYRTGNIFRAGDIEALAATLRRFVSFLHQTQPKAVADACREQALRWGYQLCRESFRNATRIAARRRNGGSQP